MTVVRQRTVQRFPELEQDPMKVASPRTYDAGHIDHVIHMVTQKAVMDVRRCLLKHLK